MERSNRLSVHRWWHRMQTRTARDEKQLANAWIRRVPVELTDHLRGSPADFDFESEPTAVGYALTDEEIDRAEIAKHHFARVRNSGSREGQRDSRLQLAFVSKPETRAG